VPKPALGGPDFGEIGNPLLVQSRDLEPAVQDGLATAARKIVCSTNPSLNGVYGIAFYF
jgi:hypothetical protein